MLAEQAKATAVEYFISKCNLTKADAAINLPVLLAFADWTFKAAERQPNPDSSIYEMICCETLDWEKYLVQAIK